MFKVLHTLLAGGHPQKYVLAKSLITAGGLPDAQVRDPQHVATTWNSAV